MIEPKLADFGLAVGDLRRAEIVTRWLAGLAFVASCATLVPASYFPLPTLHYGSLVAILQAWIWIVVFVSLMPPCGVFVFYIGLRRLANARLPFYRAVPQYRNACAKYAEWLKRTRESFWTSLTSRQFEMELTALFQHQGFEARVTGASNDQGVDIWLSKGGTSIAVQCKTHRQPVGPAIVRELYGALWHFGADRAILASLSGFTPGVREFVSDKPIQLLDLSAIVRMQLGIGEVEKDAVSESLGITAPSVGTVPQPTIAGSSIRATGSVGTGDSIEFSSEQVTTIVAQCKTASPFMACGLLLGESSDHVAKVSVVMAVPNVAKDRRTSFLVSSTDQFVAHRKAIQLGLRVIGVYYSQFRQSVEPSRVTVEAAHAELVYVIVTVSLDGRTDWKWWRMVGSRRAFWPVEVCVK